MIKRFTKKDLPLIQERVLLIRSNLEKCKEDYEKCTESYKGSAVVYNHGRMFGDKQKKLHQAYLNHQKAIEIQQDLEENDEVFLEQFEQEILGLH